MFILGDYTTADTLYLPFDTYDSNGASVTITGFAVTDIEAYKDGNTTQRVSDSGYTLLDSDGIDFDGVVGLHGFSVDLSDTTGGAFFVDGSTYWINVNAITVDGQTVRFTYYFTIGRLLKPTTAGRTLDVAATGEAGIDFGNVTGTLSGGEFAAGVFAADAIRAADLATGVLTADAFAADALIATTFATSSLDGKGDWNTVTPYANGVAVLTDAASRTASKADVSALSLEATLAGLITTVGVAGLGLSDLGGMSTGMKTEVQSECNDALVALHLDHLLAVDYDPASKPGVATALFNELVESNAGVSRYTAAALAQAPGGGNVTVGSLTTAALELFRSVDVGETTGVAGSIAKISQGSAGGNVTVETLTAAALLQFVADDTGESTAASGSVAKLSQFTLGAGTVVTFTLDGTVYCSESDINQTYGSDNVQKWADLNNNENASEITARINRAITISTNEINDILRGSLYALPITDASAAITLVDLCATIAGVWLYESRGVEDFDPESGRTVHKLSFMRDRAKKKLEAIRADRIQLDVEAATRKGTAVPRAIR